MPPVPLEKRRVACCQYISLGVSNHGQRRTQTCWLSEGTGPVNIDVHDEAAKVQGSPMKSNVRASIG